MARKKGSYAGKILRVDLSSGKIEKQDLDFDFAHKYIGGRGFGSRVLYNEVPPEVAPLDPANRLIFTPGALFGTAVPAASRTTATAKSPVTEMFGDGHSSGHWGSLLKSAGYDQLIIQGAAEKPVYLWIDNDRVEIRDAKHLWGKSNMETNESLLETHGSREIGTLSIGPAGEKKVRLACIFSDGIMGTFARTGIGAVMGSKNLKAVATRGTGDVGIVDIEAFKKAYQDYLQVIAVDPYVPPATKYGTCRFMYHRVKFGIHGANNWRLGDFDWKPLDPEVFRSDYQIKASACPMCPVRCRREYRISTGKYAGTVTKLEWETIARCMTCGVNDPEAVIYFSHLCNQYGLDVEGMGDTIAFAMECFEKGLISEKETEGLRLAFGNSDALMEITRRIAYREGLGDLLAEGSLRAARAIGKGAEKYAMQVKGSEMSAADPRGHARPGRILCHQHPRLRPSPLQPLRGGADHPRRRRSSISAARKRPTSSKGSRAKEGFWPGARISSPSGISSGSASSPTTVPRLSATCAGRAWNWRPAFTTPATGPGSPKKRCSRRANAPLIWKRPSMCAKGRGGKRTSSPSASSKKPWPGAAPATAPWWTGRNLI